MRKIALLLLCFISISTSASSAPKQPTKRYSPVPWEVMGVTEDDIVLTRIERVKTPDGWIVKILTMPSIHDSGSLNGSTTKRVDYMYIPDTKHDWNFYSKDYQKVLELEGFTKP